MALQALPYQCRFRVSRPPHGNQPDNVKCNNQILIDNVSRTLYTLWHERRYSQESRSASFHSALGTDDCFRRGPPIGPRRNGTRRSDA